MCYYYIHRYHDRNNKNSTTKKMHMLERDTKRTSQEKVLIMAEHFQSDHQISFKTFSTQKVQIHTHLLLFQLSSCYAQWAKREDCWKEAQWVHSCAKPSADATPNKKVSVAGVSLWALNCSIDTLSSPPASFLMLLSNSFVFDDNSCRKRIQTDECGTGNTPHNYCWVNFHYMVMFTQLNRNFMYVKFTVE